MQKIGIVVAMEEELEAVENILDDLEEKEIRKTIFKIGKIGKCKCIVVHCGIGKVNAARATQELIDNFDVEYVMNVGVAGSINDDLDIGDVVIGKHTVQHDFDLTAFRHSKGYIPGVGDTVKCDSNLNLRLQNSIKNLDEKKYKVKLGVVATGDIFCTDVAMKDKIRAKFDADVVDMECGAIAQVTYLNELPFTVIRSISDSPNGKNEKTFEENLPFACKRFANILKKFLGQEGQV